MRSHTLSRPVPLFKAATALTLTGLFTAVLTGCGMQSANSTGTGLTGTPLATGISGRVMGGQQPVSGATIQLYAVNLTAAKGASTALLTAPVTTGANGMFNITGQYTCPAGAYVYITATGGNPGLPGTVNNMALSMMSALGPCSTLLLNFPSLQINELTTVGSVYALAPFMADLTHIGAPATNATGLQNAFATVNSLVNVAAGTAPGAGLPTTSSVPTPELDTLANILSSCINSDGTGTPCANLFSASTPSGASTPGNTVAALLNVVRNPASNVAALYGLAPAGAPFQPTLATAPADWTVGITASGGGLSAPTSLAVDASGNVWVANSAGNSVTKLSATQALGSGASGYTAGGVLGPQAVAVDPAGNTWIANSYGGSVVEINSTGTVLSPVGGYKTAGIFSPVALAIDANNNVWVANFTGNTISGLAVSGTTATPISGGPFTASGTVSQPSALAVDSNNNLWIANSGGASLSELSSTGATLSGSSGISDGVMQAPGGLAIDNAAHVYSADTGINAVSIFGTSGAPATPLRTSAIALPASVATDGANVAWLANSGTSGSLLMLPSPTGTPVALGSLNAPRAVAVDASGSVWTANSGSNTVTQFVGLATPVRTPLASHFTSF